MSEAITIDAIAKASGFSKATISRVLHNYPKVAPGTRKVVMNLINSSGYRPNPLVSAHMTNVRHRSQKSRIGQTLALLNTLPTGVQKQDSPMQNLIMKGIHNQAEALGFKIEEFIAREWTNNSRRLATILDSRGIRGVIIGPMHHGQITFDSNWDIFSMVSIGHALKGLNFHRVCSNNFRNLYRAMGMLHDKGYRKIGLAMNQSFEFSSCQIWLGGYLGFQINRFHSLLIPPLMIDPTLAEDSPERIRQIVDYIERHELDAIIGTKSLMKALELGNVNIPSDCAFFDISVTKDTATTAGMDERSFDCGARSIDLLSELLYLNKTGVPETAKTVLIEGRWVEGWTAPGKKSNG